MLSDPWSSFDGYRQRVDGRLAKLLPSALVGQEALAGAIREGVLAPGKRLRPLMTVIAAEDLGGDSASAIDAGCAVEMVHAASLVLDDLPCMDNARMRRGRPAVHVGHGEDAAVLGAIAMLSGAYQILASIESLPAEARLRAVTALAGAVGLGGLVAGQFEDLRGGRRARQLQEISVANGLKTGSLFSAAAEIGGVVAGADEATTLKLRSFAMELGHAFQLLDDLLDGATGIATGKDADQDRGKSTMLSVLGRATVELEMERHIACAHAKLTEIFGARCRLHALVETIFERNSTAGRIAAPGERAGKAFAQS